MSKQLLQQALDYVSRYVGIDDKQADALHAALQEHLAKPMPEPVACVESWANGSYARKYTVTWLKSVDAGTKLYADAASAVNRSPQSRYTPQEMMSVIKRCRGSVSFHLDKYEQLSMKLNDEPPWQNAAASEAERLVTLLDQMDTMLAQEKP